MDGSFKNVPKDGKSSHGSQKTQEPQNIKRDRQRTSKGYQRTAEESQQFEEDSRNTQKDSPLGTLGSPKPTRFSGVSTNFEGSKALGAYKQQETEDCTLVGMSSHSHRLTHDTSKPLVQYLVNHLMHTSSVINKRGISFTFQASLQLSLVFPDTTTILLKLSTILELGDTSTLVKD